MTEKGRERERKGMRGCMPLPVLHTPVLVAPAPAAWVDLSTITYGLLTAGAAVPCFMCTGVEVGVRGNGEGLGVDMGDPKETEENSQQNNASFHY